MEVFEAFVIRFDHFTGQWTVRPRVHQISSTSTFCISSHSADGLSSVIALKVFSTNEIIAWVVGVSVEAGLRSLQMLHTDCVFEMLDTWLQVHVLVRLLAW